MPALEGMSIDDLRDTVRALKQKHYTDARGGLSAIELERYMEARRLYSAKLDALPVVKGVSTAGDDLGVGSTSAVFVVVEDDGQRTLRSVRNIGVHSSLHAAKACAWRAILEQASKPWTAAFYEDREAEFAHCCGIPYLTVEEWSWMGIPTPSKKHPVGWRDAVDSGSGSGGGQDLCWFDASLKRECKRYDAYVKGLLRDLVERSRFPTE